MSSIEKLAECLRCAMEDWCFEQGWNITQRPDMVCIDDGLGNMKASQLAVVYLQDDNRNEALAAAICQARELSDD